MNLLWNAQEDIRSLKSLILFGVRGMAAYAHHAMMLGYADEEVNRFFAKALFAVGEDWDMDALLPIVMEVGEKNLQCMALLDKDVYKRQDDVFELLAWNQGIGFFSSEIGPSALFQAYKLIKNGEKQGKSREDICSALREKFGEKNPEMQVLN